MHLLITDRSVKGPIGILYDVLVKVVNFKFLVDFLILDCLVDFTVLITIGRPFFFHGESTSGYGKE